MIRRQVIIAILGIFLATSAFTAELRGRVVGVSDGDTFTLLTADHHQVKIRLAEIDAPESGQPYGNKSKQALSDLIYGKDVLVQVQTKDRYGRTVGRPYFNNLDVCVEMLRVGAAWAYREYLRDEGLLGIEAGQGPQKGAYGAFQKPKTCPRGSGDDLVAAMNPVNARSRAISTVKAIGFTTYQGRNLMERPRSMK